MTRLDAGSATDIGRRQINQDRVLVAADHQLFAVADGMGGHRRGEVAAQMTVTHLAERFAHHASLEALIDGVAGANQLVFQASANDAELQGMGTTITALALIVADGEQRLAIANVGDSRTYLLRGGELEQLTEDHSLVAELMREGHLTAEGARNHRQRSVLTKALGVEPTIEPDIIEVLPSIGDRYLLCSDGLCGEVSDEQTAAVLRRLADPAEAARELVRLALVSGGSDNISVVVVDVVDDDHAALRASSAVDATHQSAGRATFPLREEPEQRTASATPPPVPAPAGQRRPRLITWRVLLFVLLLGAVGAVAAWAVSNSPDDPTPALSTVTVAPPTTLDPFAPVETTIEGGTSTTPASAGPNSTGPNVTLGLNPTTLDPGTLDPGTLNPGITTG